jgi:hypothetical protein
VGKVDPEEIDPAALERLDYLGVQRRWPQGAEDLDLPSDQGFRRRNEGSS